MNSGFHNHQIGMDYLYDAIFKMATSEVKLRYNVYNSAARIDRNNIFQMRSYLGHLASCHLPTATWAGINDPCNYYTVCSLPSIIVRGPAVTQNKSQRVHVMNEVWYSDAFAPKFVLRKVFSIARSLLESDDGITINRDIWAVFGSGRDMHISTALYCAYAEKAPKHLWCKGVRARHVCSHWYIFIHSLLETSGCKGCLGSFTHSIAP